MANQFRVNQLLLSGVDATQVFYPRTNPSGFILASQTGNYVDAGSSLGTGSGLFSAKSGTQLQFKTAIPGSGMTFGGDSNTLSFNTVMGNQLKNSMQLDTVLTTGNLYYNLVSGVVGPGVWLTVAQTTFRTQSNVSAAIKVSTQLWNGNTGAGIYSSAEASISTSGQAISGFVPIDLTAIVTLTGASNTVALRGISTAGNTYALSSLSDFQTGVLSGMATYLHMVRLL